MIQFILIMLCFLAYSYVLRYFIWNSAYKKGIEISLNTFKDVLKKEVIRMSSVENVNEGTKQKFIQETTKYFQKIAGNCLVCNKNYISVNDALTNDLVYLGRNEDAYVICCKDCLPTYKDS